MISAIVSTISVTTGRLMRSPYNLGSWNSHRLVVKYRWVRVHDWRLERFPLRIVGHCFENLRCFILVFVLFYTLYTCFCVVEIIR